MTRKALIVGVDQYDDSQIGDLSGCINDAKRFSDLIEFHGDNSPNFDTKLFVQNVNSGSLLQKVNWLFEGEADTVLFYFAGHGIFDESADFGYIVTKDGRNPSWGVNIDTILGLANSAYPRIRNTIIIFDCCHSGHIGDSGLRNGASYATIGKGVTIMTACTSKQVAMEYGGEGLFTSTLINGLEGEAADVLGDITPALLYAHVDRSLGAFDQRPLYKTNVHTFNCLRKVLTGVSKADLRKLPRLFNSADDVYALDPSCEPFEDRGVHLEASKDIEFDEKNHETYRMLQTLRGKNLVVPVDRKHMWNAAMESKGCKLTRLGRHYYHLAKNGRFGKVDD